jgi:hypothetical protein
MQKTIKIPHPDNDGTWVEFSNMSIRQVDILKDYIKYTSGHRSKRRYSTESKKSPHVMDGR